MLSTQRLLMIIVAINLVTGIALDCYENSRNYSESAITNSILIGEQYNAWQRDQETTARPSATTQLEENTYGSSLSMSWRIFSIFYHGLHPYPFKSGTFENGVENVILSILIFFKSLMFILIGLEIYLLIKNKKTG